MSSKQELFCASLGLFLIILFAHTIDNTNASQAILQAKNHPTNKALCVHEGETYKIGKAPIKGECGVIECSDDCLCFFTGCGAVGVRPPCYLIEEKEKPYPDCCPQPVCPSENAIR